MQLKFRRLLALLIDFILIFSIVYLPSSLISSLALNTIVNIIIGFIVIIVFYQLFIHKDTIFQNTSIGKKMLRIYILNENNDKIIDKKILIKRNETTFKVFPIYIFQILINNKSLGDYKYNTRVDLIKK